MPAAARCLSGWIGRTVFEGVGRDPRRADYEIAAVLEYLRLSHEPQLSWRREDFRTLQSQGMEIVRSPGEVLAEGAGSCLDLVCLVAAVLYRCNHDPWVVILDSQAEGPWRPAHAVLGYWRTARLGYESAVLLESGFRRLVDYNSVWLADVAQAIASAASGRLPVFEPRSPLAGSLTELEAPGYRLRYAVDVRAVYETRGWRPHSPAGPAPLGLGEVAALFQRSGDAEGAEAVRAMRASVDNPDEFACKVLELAEGRLPADQAGVPEALQRRLRDLPLEGRVHQIADTLEQFSLWWVSRRD